MEVWTKIILPIISGLAACVPLAIKLIEYSQKVTKEKNWTALMHLVLRFMIEAEEKYETGAEKKEYVINSVASIKSTLNYDVDMKVVEEIIDSIVEATKKINVEKK